MNWEAMTIDEYAEFQIASGVKTIKIDGIWWTEARPFFFRPLFPFAKLAQENAKYPLQSVLGGVLHPVPEGTPSNSCMNFFLYDDLREYSIDKFSTKQRWIIKQGLKNFEARRITDLRMFIDEAYPIFAEFYDRTRYFYKKERKERDSFAAWAELFFRFPKVFVMGGFYQGRLCAVDISYRVEDIIIEDTFFSDRECQKLRVTDFFVHTLREAARSSDASVLFRGFPSGKQTLDESKVRRDCKVLKMPAYCRINPIALYIGKAFMNRSYRKYLAMTGCTDTFTQAGGAVSAIILANFFS
jgi:hypothetical protein